MEEVPYTDMEIQISAIRLQYARNLPKGFIDEKSIQMNKFCGTWYFLVFLLAIHKLVRSVFYFSIHVSTVLKIVLHLIYVDVKFWKTNTNNGTKFLDTVRTSSHTFSINFVV